MNREVIQHQRVEHVKQGACLPKRSPANIQSTSPNFRELRVAWSRQDEDLSAAQSTSARSLPSASEYAQKQPNIITQYSQIAVLRRKKVMNTIVLVGILMVFAVFLSTPVTICFTFPGVPAIYITITAGLWCLNSLINPLMYCWKIPEVRDAVTELLRKVFRCA
jgi:hypothetical protein